MTVSDLIKSSLRLIGAISSSETPSASEQADALLALNDMVGSWSNEGLMLHKYVREVFPLVAGQSRYTMGPSGNFNTVKPMRISEVAATVPTIVVTELTPYDPGDPGGMPPVDPTPATYSTEYFATIETPIQILNIQEWAQIPDKTTQSTIPRRMYVEGTNPLESINLWPVPSSNSGIVLYALKQFTAFANGAEVITLPPGYTRALRYGLALELSAEYGKPPSQLIAGIANEAKADLKRQNAQPVYMVSDAYGLASKPQFDILIGE